VAEQFESATIFGASLSATFLGSPDDLNVRIVTSVLIVLMSATTFLTQRQLMTKNMPASALDNPFAKQQKVLLYVLPIVFAVSGVNFPIGVLIYWFTTNVWSMCQQFYVIRRMPAPGSAAEKALHARLERKGKPIPGVDAAKAKADAEAAEAAEQVRQSGQRQQPASKKRKKSKAAGAKPAGQGGAKAGIQDTPTTSARGGAGSGIQDTPAPSAGRPAKPTQNGKKQDGPTAAGTKTGNVAKPPTT
jgi:YidC/Oxa1 family membrane protein insertase